MKRVFAGVGVVAAIMTAGAGVAVAEVPAHGVQQVAEPSTGSGDLLTGQLYHLFTQLASGSSQPCDGIQTDVCLPTPTP
ncbi:hypothetical protein [Nocardia lasii]|uniref:Secreted protein n=1 Tax=Nocardia lasii TaxID=1616107 RepID=A0ABW1JKK6_9NOCA